MDGRNGPSILFCKDKLAHAGPREGLVQSRKVVSGRESEVLLDGGHGYEVERSRDFALGADDTLYAIS